MHRGELDAAQGLMTQGRDLARRQGDRLSEYQALMNLAILELQRDNFAAAGVHAMEMAGIGDKVREGSEAPFARVLQALIDYADDDRADPAPLDSAIEALRVADAKYRLAVAQSVAATVELRRGEAARARARAEEVLDAAEALQRPSERAMARLLLLRAAEELGDASAVEEHVAALARTPLRLVSSYVRGQIEEELHERERDRKRGDRKRG
jgi:hypothetical protein